MDARAGIGRPDRRVAQPAVAGVGDDAGQQDGHQKGCAPGQEVGEDGAQHRPGQRGQGPDRVAERIGRPLQVRRDPLDDDRQRHGQQEAGGEALQQAQAGDRLHGGGERGREPGNGEQHAAEDERVPGTEAIDDGTADREADGEGGRVAADDERVAVEATEVAGGTRQRRRDQQHVGGGDE